MKLNKRILKEIVKECLIEILAEGLVSDGNSPQQKRMALKESVMSRAQTANHEPEPAFKRPSYLDNINFPGTSGDTPSRAVAEQAKPMPMNLTKDPIMNEIFADTAATTLREQRSADSRSPSAPVKHHDQASAIVDKTPLDDLFGGASDKWASLAFAPAVGAARGK